MAWTINMDLDWPKAAEMGICFLLPSVVDTHCCAWAVPSCGEWGLLSSCAALTAHCGASLVVERGLSGQWASVFVACGLSSFSSWILEHRLNSCARGLCSSAACGIFPDQGSNPHLPHGQADPLSLSHQGSPDLHF